MNIGRSVMKRYTASVMKTSMLDVYALTYLQNKPKKILTLKCKNGSFCECLTWLCKIDQTLRLKSYVPEFVDTACSTLHVQSILTIKSYVPVTNKS